ncbi:MAG: hypothetical protein BMS9Abin31_0479 [Gammaproteobacteria bacterium]|nr:MAG: hypothetical protein BMS9Abin31_0479 [Gammaproteobacteria bacterium]
MQKEHKYIVLKKSDANKYLSQAQKEQLTDAISAIQRGRRLEGKRYKYYVCIADDWPIYKDAWNLVEKWVDKKSK